MEPKLLATTSEDKCPYSLGGNGCSCYENRPVICRLYGNSGIIGDVGIIKNVNLACPLGIKPTSPLDKKQARNIFMTYINLIRKEAIDKLNQGTELRYAGPYAAFMGRR